MKKDKLYSYGKKGNIFWPGGELNLNDYSWVPTFANTPLPTGGTLDKSVLENVQKQMVGNTGASNPNALTKSLTGIVGSQVGNLLATTLSNGYSVGNGFNSALSTIRNINTGNPLIDGIKNGVATAGQIIGNLGWGTKKNSQNINTLQENTAQASMAGNALSSSATSNDFMNSAAMMTSGTGFNTKDLVKGGWFAKGKARREGQKYLDKENAALALQKQGMITGAHNVDDIMDDNVMSNFAAYGGLLGSLEDNNMGAINYGFMSDYLTAKQKQNDIKNKLSGMTSMPTFMQSFADGGEIHIKHPGRLTRLKERTGKTEAELWAEGKPEVKKMIIFARNARAWSKANGGRLHKDGVSVPENVLCGGGRMFDLGGDIQTNSADWTTGLTHIDAGGSHSENPNQGVQIGVDREGTPNLVEEGERIFNDYVYSKRIFADGGTLEKFHLSKKRKITFADLAELLEKESRERPNDPISQAALKVQMQDLADQQERQKQEMEAERARKAFEALSDEEKVALMQQAAQQEQAAQQQAMQEQAMAEQQMMQESAAQPQGTPEQMAIMQQQAQGQAAMGQPEVMAEAPMMAYGGKVNKFAPGGNVNVGTWKEEYSNPWDVFTRPGLKAYMENAKARIDMAPEDKKAEVRKSIMDEFNALQQSYYDNVLFNIGHNTYGYSDDIKGHQNMFNDMYGNTGFYRTDENGDMLNIVAEAINLPKGHYTGDVPSNWADGYNGPQTSIRNFGSTEYGDDAYYADLVKGFQELGFNYSPDDKLTYHNVDDENNAFHLYTLSMPEAQQSKPESALGAILDTVPWGQKNNSTAPSTPLGIPDGASPASPTPPTNTDTAKKSNGEDEWEVTPNYRDENLRYAGLFGPAVGLGMQALGIGRPDTKGLEAVVEGYDKTGSAMADYRPIGDYLRYTPMDIWAEQNRLNANTRATDRALINNSAPIGTRAAGLLANAYNNQIGSGELYRKALEYNDALRERTASFNKDTNKFNAEAYNRAALQNAETNNRDRQLRANLGMQVAQAKMDADAGWYNGIYGNVSGLFKGISDLGRENAQHNMIAEMAADELFGPISPRTNTGRRGKYLTFTKKSAAKGGNIKKERR